jgi:3-hydroxybutyryl-CoA dehydrogenase
MDIRSIFVVGAGTMGNGIAQVAATSGYQVTMMDVVPGQVERAQAAIAKSVEKLLSKGAITEEQKQAALNIKTSMNLEGVSDSELVIEAATENPELKLNLFRELDVIAKPGAILASNNSQHSGCVPENGQRTG